MADFMMIMKGQGSAEDTADDWSSYINKLIATGTFRGGSAFGNSRCLSASKPHAAFVATGFMRFEAETIDEIEALVADNPIFKSGGEIELHELVVT